MNPKTTNQWDIAEHLQTDEDMAASLDGALAENDPVTLLVVLGDIVRAKGIDYVSKQLRMQPDRLQKMLSQTGRPTFATVLMVIRALGFQLHVSPSAE